MARVGEEEETMPRAIWMLSSLLERVAESNESNRSASEEEEEGYGNQIQKRSVFEGLTRPSISIRSYLERIFKYANCSSCCFVVAYVYLRRLAHSNSSLLINSFTVHRLLLTAVMLSAKFMDDRYYNNAYYAKIGGISTSEMNLLELDFLFGLRFQLNVTPTAFDTYCSYLQTEMLLHSPPLNTHRPLNLQSCFNEDDEPNSHQRELAV